MSRHPSRPIETFYGGVRFRSRLEARWAVYFDEVGVTWEYEPETFELSDGRWYIPDFRLQGSIWAEVKPPGGDFEKARLFHDRIVLLDGPPRLSPVFRALHTGYDDDAHGDWVFVGAGDSTAPGFFWAWGGGFEAVDLDYGTTIDRAVSKALSERFGAYP